MKTTRKVVVEQDEIASVVCNKCGKTIKPPMECYASFTYSGGYYSENGIHDGDHYSFELCEKCLVDLMKSMKVPPAYSNYLFPGYVPPHRIGLIPPRNIVRHRGSVGKAKK